MGRYSSLQLACQRASDTSIHTPFFSRFSAVPVARFQDVSISRSRPFSAHGGFFFLPFPFLCPRLRRRTVPPQREVPIVLLAANRAQPSARRGMARRYHRESFRCEDLAREHVFVVCFPHFSARCANGHSVLLSLAFIRPFHLRSRIAA